MRLRPCLSALLAPIALAGCASPQTHLLTLDAVAPGPDGVRANYRGLPIAIPAVHVPVTLDRAEYVDQVSAGEAKVDDFAHWAAPLGLLARDALVRDLIARLPAGAVLPPGSGGRAGSVRTIDVTILALGTRPGTAFLQAAYRVLPDGPLRQVELDGTVESDGPAGGARAFAGLIGKLADRIVLDLP